MAGSGMEVDPPTTSGIAIPGMGTLKRSNSAPMINVLGSPLRPSSPNLSSSPCSSTNGESPGASLSGSAHSSSSASSGLSHAFRPAEVNRMRRFSASCAQGLHSPTGVKTPNRLDQLKHEESITIKEREAAHEREIQQSMQISQSWEELSLDERHERHEPMVTDNKQRPKSFAEPLHISTLHYQYSCSPSPTRSTGKQCFSPSLQAPVKNSTLTPSPSPSPTRKSFSRRSASPIATGQLRPSRLGLGMKRKAEFEESERPEMYFSPPKRFQSGLTTPEKHHTVHPLVQCLSAPRSQGDNSSPEQQVPNVVITTISNAPSRSISTPAMCYTTYPATTTASQTLSFPASTSPASCFTFRPVRDSIDTHATDSDQASDMTEATDLSEPPDNLCSSEQSPANSFNTSSKSHQQPPLL